MTMWYARPAARRWQCAAEPEVASRHGGAAPGTGAPSSAGSPSGAGSSSGAGLLPAAAAFHARLPGYRPTPLIELPGLAAELGVGRLFAKDESARFGLGAFKVLGASWAVCRLLADRAGVPAAGGLAAGGLAAGGLAGGGLAGGGLAELRALAAEAPVTLVTATDGNHGRAVARMARWLGLPARVYLPAAVHPGTADAIAAEGATVVHVDGSYDDAVARAAAFARREPAAELVQDTGWEGYQRVPAWIVQGYATLFHEIDAQLRAAGVAAGPGLVAVPVGVGSLAQAAVAHYRGRTPGATPEVAPEPPAILGVEPESAACVLASLLASELRSVPTGTTVMAGLNCGTPSGLAWPYLLAGMDAAIAVRDEDAERAVADLGRLGVRAGPSGGAALAGARRALTGAGSDHRRAELGSHGRTVAVLLSTEGNGVSSSTTTARSGGT